jgi:hypothetical protein
MSELQSDTLYNVVENSDKSLLRPPNDNYLICCCCITEKWCFDHTGISGNREYDDTVYNCCTCLDCCTWCLEFRIKKYSICIKQTNFYLCCCSIYFIE